MNEAIRASLAGAGIELTEPAPPRYHYVHFTTAGDIAYFSGKTSVGPGPLSYRGKVGGTLSIDEAGEAARACAVNLLAAIEFGVGLERVRRILKLTGFVASTPDFVDQAVVVDAASRLFVEVLGDSGRHARSAIGVAALPGDSAVELELVIQLADSRGEGETES